MTWPVEPFSVRKVLPAQNLLVNLRKGSHP